MTQDQKQDEGKPRLELVPPGTDLRIGQVLTQSLAKYGEGTWKNVSAQFHVGALMRHLEAFRMGRVIDDDSGLPHLDHMLANAAFLSWMCRNNDSTSP